MDTSVLNDNYEIAINEMKKSIRHSFEEIARARKEVALAKVPAFIDYAIDVIESESKVVIFAHHLEVVALLMEGFKEFNPVRVTGDDSTNERQIAVETFQNDPSCHVIIGTIGAMGVGYTLTASSTVIFCEMSWVPADMTQAEDRLHRLGQHNTVNVIHVVLDGSIDQHLAEVLIEKQNIADKSLDGLHASLPTKLDVITTIAEVKKEYKEIQYKEETKTKVLASLQFLASCCDGAQTKDGTGFNQFDTNLGHTLANLNQLNNKQTYLGLRLCRKYNRQLKSFSIEEE